MDKLISDRFDMTIGPNLKALNFIGNFTTVIEEYSIWPANNIITASTLIKTVILHFFCCTEFGLVLSSQG